MTLSYLEPVAESVAPELPYITDRRHRPIIMTLNPTLASAWLQKVPETQRTVRDNAVDEFKKEMLAGNWITDYSPYRFDKRGRLIDGQHRLWAIKESGVVLEEQAIVFGMEPKDYEKLDQGTKRNFADTLKYYGHPNFMLMSSLAYRMYDWERGKTFRKNRDRPAQRELLAMVNAHSDEMQEAIKIGRKVSFNVKPFIGSVASLAWILCNRIDESDTEQFFGRLIDGQGLLEGDPIYTLRNKWAVNAAKKRDEVPDYVQGAHLLKTWNYYREGRRVELLLWKSGGAKPEAFPQPK